MNPCTHQFIKIDWLKETDSFGKEAFLTIVMCPHCGQVRHLNRLDGSILVVVQEGAIKFKQHESSNSNGVAFDPNSTAAGQAATTIHP